MMRCTNKIINNDDRLFVKIINIVCRESENKMLHIYNTHALLEGYVWQHKVFDTDQYNKNAHHACPMDSHKISAFAKTIWSKLHITTLFSLILSFCFSFFGFLLLFCIIFCCKQHQALVYIYYTLCTLYVPARISQYTLVCLNCFSLYGMYIHMSK